MEKEGKREIRFKVSLKKHKELEEKAKKMDVPISSYIKMKLNGEE